MKSNIIKEVKILLLLIIVLTAAFFLGDYAFLKSKQSYLFKNYQTSVFVGDNLLFVRVASKEASREIGLSNSLPLHSNQGMLFIFNSADNYGFWMKDMIFPIDIIWIGENKKIVYIEKNVLPESYPKNFSPNVKAMYVLEVLSGFSEKHNIKIGDEVFF